MKKRNFYIKKKRNSFKTSKNVLLSLRFAVYGILYCFRNSRNFRIELCLASLALLAGIIFQINFDQFFILFVTIFSVLILELLNTAIESVVDLIVENRFSKLAEIAKDCSAGSVLLSALNAIFVAVYIFFPRIKLLLNNF